MQKKLTQMLHMQREPVGIYFGNTTAVKWIWAEASTISASCPIPTTRKR